MIRDRQKRVPVGLIDALDMTALAVEAGLFPLQVMMHVAEDLRPTHSELCDDLYLVCHDMHAGSSWDEALLNMSERTGVRDIKALSELIRNDPLGVLWAFKTCANSLRTELRQHAKAMTMVPALVAFGVVFILPVISVVILGPALIQLYRTLIA